MGKDNPKIGLCCLPTCSCCCLANSICCCCFSNSIAAMFFCSEWAVNSWSRRVDSWLIMTSSCSSFSARLSWVPVTSKRTSRKQKRWSLGLHWLTYGFEKLILNILWLIIQAADLASKNLLMHLHSKAIGGMQDWRRANMMNILEWEPLSSNPHFGMKLTN